MKVAAVIMAAGGATRFGRPKQLLEINGENLVQRCCRLAMDTGCSPLVVVLGANSELIRAAGIPKGVTVVENHRWQDGMGSSLALGIGEVSESDADAALILLADQPGVNVTTIKSMEARFLDPAVSIVLCDHGESWGPPSLFHRSHFLDLAKLSGDQGGRIVSRKHPDSTATVFAPETAWDIDDEEAWSEFLATSR